MRFVEGVFDSDSGFSVDGPVLTHVHCDDSLIGFQFPKIKRVVLHEASEYFAVVGSFEAGDIFGSSFKGVEDIELFDVSKFGAFEVEVGHLLGPVTSVHQGVD